jgi:hypothetical protein
MARIGANEMEAHDIKTIVNPDVLGRTGQRNPSHHTREVTGSSPVSPTFQVTSTPTLTTSIPDKGEVHSVHTNEHGEEQAQADPFAQAT